MLFNSISFPLFLMLSFRPFFFSFVRTLFPLFPFYFSALSHSLIFSFVFFLPLCGTINVCEPYVRSGRKHLCSLFTIQGWRQISLHGATVYTKSSRFLSDYLFNNFLFVHLHCLSWIVLFLYSQVFSPSTLLSSYSFSHLLSHKRNEQVKAPKIMMAVTMMLIIIKVMIIEITITAATATTR